MQGTIEANQTGIKLTPEYFAFLLYRHHSGKSVLLTSTRSPMVTFDNHLPSLDATATLSADRRTLYLAVINRNEEQDMSATIDVQGWEPQTDCPVQVFELNGKDRDATNPFNSSESVNIRQKTIDIRNLPLLFRFSAHSATVLEFAGSTARQ